MALSGARGKTRMALCTVVGSLCSEKGMTQAGLVYLCTALAKKGYAADVLDLGGSVEFYAPPEELWSTCDSVSWMNADSIRDGEWMDEYLPPVHLARDLVFFSAQFSPDVVFHARYSHGIRARNPQAVTAIGGAALAGLRKDQLGLIAQFFDYVLVGYDVERLLGAVFEGAGRSREGTIVRGMAAPKLRPDYSLVPLGDFVTVYTGHGCYYAGCRFCDFPARADGEVVFRKPHQVAREVLDVLTMRPDVEDVFLTQDSYTQRYLLETTREIRRQCGTAPYSLMLRAEPWVREETGEALACSGCTDVFIGAEGLDDEVLGVLNKGLSTQDILAAIKALSQFVDVTIGMILFVPGVSERAMQAQLVRLEEALPYVSRIELEILTVVTGSEFARHPGRYGIVLNATENIINDSWCFGLSQDIPWTMADRERIGEWVSHAEELRSLCSEWVDPIYWENIERLGSDLRCRSRA